MGRRALLVGLVVATLAPLAVHGGPREEKDLSPEARLEKDLADLRRSVAAGHRDLSQWCRYKGLRRTALLHQMLAFRFDSENEATRRSLGYRPVRGGWKLGRAPDLEELDDNQSPPDEYVRRDAEIRAMRVRELLAIAARAKRDGLENRIGGLLGEAVRIAPDDADVHRALRHREVAGRWFAEEEAAVPPETVAIRAAEGSEIGKKQGTAETGPWKRSAALPSSPAFRRRPSRG